MNSWRLSLCSEVDSSEREQRDNDRLSLSQGPPRPGSVMLEAIAGASAFVGSEQGVSSR